MNDSTIELTIVQKVSKRIFKPLSEPTLEILRDDILTLTGEKYHEKFHTENESICEAGCEVDLMIARVFSSSTEGGSLAVEEKADAS